MRILFAKCFRIPHRHGGFDHDNGVWIDLCDSFYDLLDRGCVKVIFFRIIIRRGSDDDKIRTRICFLIVQSGLQVQLPRFQIERDLCVHNGRFPGIDQIYLLRDQIQSVHLVFLGKDDGVR